MAVPQEIHMEDTRQVKDEVQDRLQVARALRAQLEEKQTLVASRQALLVDMIAQIQAEGDTKRQDVQALFEKLYSELEQRKTLMLAHVELCQKVAMAECRDRQQQLEGDMATLLQVSATVSDLATTTTADPSRSFEQGIAEIQAWMAEECDPEIRERCQEIKLKTPACLSVLPVDVPGFCNTIGLEEGGHSSSYSQHSVAGVSRSSVVYAVSELDQGQSPAAASSNICSTITEPPVTAAMEELAESSQEGEGGAAASTPASARSLSRIPLTYEKPETPRPAAQGAVLRKALSDTKPGCSCSCEPVESRAEAMLAEPPPGPQAREGLGAKFCSRIEARRIRPIPCDGKTVCITSDFPLCLREVSAGSPSALADGESTKHIYLSPGGSPVCGRPPCAEAARARAQRANKGDVYIIGGSRAGGRPCLQTGQPEVECAVYYHGGSSPPSSTCPNVPGASPKSIISNKPCLSSPVRCSDPAVTSAYDAVSAATTRSPVTVGQYAFPLPSATLMPGSMCPGNCTDPTNMVLFNSPLPHLSSLVSPAVQAIVPASPPYPCPAATLGLKGNCSAHCAASTADTSGSQTNAVNCGTYWSTLQSIPEGDEGAKSSVSGSNSNASFSPEPEEEACTCMCAEDGGLWIPVADPHSSPWDWGSVNQNAHLSSTEVSPLKQEQRTPTDPDRAQTGEMQGEASSHTDDCDYGWPNKQRYDEDQSAPTEFSSVTAGGDPGDQRMTTSRYSGNQRLSFARVPIETGNKYCSSSSDPCTCSSGLGARGTKAVFMSTPDVASNTECGDSQTPSSVPWSEGGNVSSAECVTIHLDSTLFQTSPGTCPDENDESHFDFGHEQADLGREDSVPGCRDYIVLSPSLSPPGYTPDTEQACTTTDWDVDQGWPRDRSDNRHCSDEQAASDLETTDCPPMTQQSQDAERDYHNNMQPELQPQREEEEGRFDCPQGHQDFLPCICPQASPENSYGDGVSSGCGAPHRSSVFAQCAAIRSRIYHRDRMSNIHADDKPPRPYFPKIVNTSRNRTSSSPTIPEGFSREKFFPSLPRLMCASQDKPPSGATNPARPCSTALKRPTSPSQPRYASCRWSTPNMAPQWRPQPDIRSPYALKTSRSFSSPPNARCRLLDPIDWSPSACSRMGWARDRSPLGDPVPPTSVPRTLRLATPGDLPPRPPRFPQSRTPRDRSNQSQSACSFQHPPDPDKVLVDHLVPSQPEGVGRRQGSEPCPPGLPGLPAALRNYGSVVPAGSRVLEWKLPNASAMRESVRTNVVTTFGRNSLGDPGRMRGYSRQSKQSSDSYGSSPSWRRSRSSRTSSDSRPQSVQPPSPITSSYLKELCELLEAMPATLEEIDSPMDESFQPANDASTEEGYDSYPSETDKASPQSLPDTNVKTGASHQVSNAGDSNDVVLNIVINDSDGGRTWQIVSPELSTPCWSEESPTTHSQLQASDGSSDLNGAGPGGEGLYQTGSSGPENSTPESYTAFYSLDVPGQCSMGSPPHAGFQSYDSAQSDGQMETLSGGTHPGSEIAIPSAAASLPGHLAPVVHPVASESSGFATQCFDPVDIQHVYIVDNGTTNTFPKIFVSRDGGTGNIPVCESNLSCEMRQQYVFSCDSGQVFLSTSVSSGTGPDIQNLHGIMPFSEVNAQSESPRAQEVLPYAAFPGADSQQVTQTAQLILTRTQLVPESSHQPQIENQVLFAPSVSQESTFFPGTTGTPQFSFLYQGPSSSPPPPPAGLATQRVPHPCAVPSSTNLSGPEENVLHRAFKSCNGPTLMTLAPSGQGSQTQVTASLSQSGLRAASGQSLDSHLQPENAEAIAQLVRDLFLNVHRILKNQQGRQVGSGSWQHQNQASAERDSSSSPQSPRRRTTRTGGSRDGGQAREKGAGNETPTVSDSNTDVAVQLASSLMDPRFVEDWVSIVGKSFSEVVNFIGLSPSPDTLHPSDGSFSANDAFLGLHEALSSLKVYSPISNRTSLNSLLMENESERSTRSVARGVASPVSGGSSVEFVSPTTFVLQQNKSSEYDSPSRSKESSPAKETLDTGESDYRGSKEGTPSSVEGGSGGFSHAHSTPRDKTGESVVLLVTPPSEEVTKEESKSAVPAHSPTAAKGAGAALPSTAASDSTPDSATNQACSRVETDTEKASIESLPSDTVATSPPRQRRDAAVGVSTQQQTSPLPSPKTKVSTCDASTQSTEDGPPVCPPRSEVASRQGTPGEQGGRADPDRRELSPCKQQENANPASGTSRVAQTSPRPRAKGSPRREVVVLEVHSIPPTPNPSHDSCRTSSREGRGEETASPSDQGTSPDVLGQRGVTGLESGEEAGHGKREFGRRSQSPRVHYIDGIPVQAINSTSVLSTDSFCEPLIDNIIDWARDDCIPSVGAWEVQDLTSEQRCVPLSLEDPDSASGLLLEAYVREDGTLELRPSPGGELLTDLLIEDVWKASLEQQTGKRRKRKRKSKKRSRKGADSLHCLHSSGDLQRRRGQTRKGRKKRGSKSSLDTDSGLMAWTPVPTTPCPGFPSLPSPESLVQKYYKKKREYIGSQAKLPGDERKGASVHDGQAAMREGEQRRPTNPGLRERGSQFAASHPARRTRTPQPLQARHPGRPERGDHQAHAGELHPQGKAPPGPRGRSVCTPGTGEGEAPLSTDTKQRQVRTGDTTGLHETTVGRGDRLGRPPIAKRFGGVKPRAPEVAHVSKQCLSDGSTAMRASLDKKRSWTPSPRGQAKKKQESAADSAPMAVEATVQMDVPLKEECMGTGGQGEDRRKGDLEWDKGEKAKLVEATENLAPAETRALVLAEKSTVYEPPALLPRWLAPKLLEPKVKHFNRFLLVEVCWVPCPQAHHYRLTTRGPGVGVGARGVQQEEVVTVEDIRRPGVVLHHALFGARYRLSVEAMDDRGAVLAVSDPAVLATPWMVHLEHVQFDPCGRHGEVVVDASMHGLHWRGARGSLGRGEWRDDPLHVLPGASTCYPFFAPTVPLAFWACRLSLAVLARPKGQSVVCNVGVCHESAVDDAGALCQNSRSLCVVLMKRGTDIVRKFWDGWSQELFYSATGGDVVLSLKERSHAVFQLGFLLNLARRRLVVVDPGKDEILQEFTLPEEEVVWLPCASLHQQDKVESSVCWLRPDRLPDCLVPQLTPY